ncbi:MAG TPA: hypothetical protein VJ307_04835 [Candidatus Deferrimicrobiaceae bacterium]|nr:hypothetical protein [Candidatus Deferrimicrobiaceae bacterium]
MWEFLNKLGWGPLIFAAVLLGLAPFRPEPHLVEKLRMLVQGTLRKPIDILDLLFHLAPLILIVLKLFAREK